MAAQTKRTSNARTSRSKAVKPTPQVSEAVEPAQVSSEGKNEGFKVGDRVYIDTNSQAAWKILKIDGAIAHLQKLSNRFENTFELSRLRPWEFKYYPEQWVKVKGAAYPLYIDEVDLFRTEPDDGVRYYKALAANWLGDEDHKTIAQGEIEYEVSEPAWVNLDDGDRVIAKFEQGWIPGKIIDGYSHADTVEAVVEWDTGETSKIQLQELLPFELHWKVGDRVTEDINTENAYKDGWASELNRQHGTIVCFTRSSGKFYPQIRTAEGSMSVCMVNPQCLQPYAGNEPLPEPEPAAPPMTAEQVIEEMDKAMQAAAEPVEPIAGGAAEPEGLITTELESQDEELIPPEQAIAPDLEKSDSLSDISTAIVPSDLHQLATQINDLQSQADEAETTSIAAGKAALQLRKQQGDRLLEAKSHVPHGQWGTWLKENCPAVGDRSAQLYMQIAKPENWQQLEAVMQPDTTYKDAIGILRRLKSAVPADEPPFEEVQQKFDEFAPGAFKRAVSGKHPYCFEVVGWSIVFDSLTQAQAKLDYCRAKAARIHNYQNPPAAIAGLQTGDAIESELQGGRVMAIAPHLEVQWEDGTLDKLTPGQFVDFGYRRADAKTETVSDLEVPQVEQAVPTVAPSNAVETVESVNLSAVKPVDRARAAAEQFIVQFGRGLSMKDVAIKILSWCSDGELETIELWMNEEFDRRKEVA
ncbi:DUF3102 domain-containing protein [Phormidium tenue FACHB-886]|nr:DUF3102 domain-containing protein [Phormidium tenue FACHB-886]